MGFTVFDHGQGFVDALHESFVISGTALFIAALLVAFLLQDTRRSLSTSVELADPQVTTGAIIISQAASVIQVENCVLLERGEQA